MIIHFFYFLSLLNQLERYCKMCRKDHSEYGSPSLRPFPRGKARDILKQNLTLPTYGSFSLKQILSQRMLNEKKGSTVDNLIKYTSNIHPL